MALTGLANELVKRRAFLATQATDVRLKQLKWTVDRFGWYVREMHNATCITIDINICPYNKAAAKPPADDTGQSTKPQYHLSPTSCHTVPYHKRFLLLTSNLFP